VQTASAKSGLLNSWKEIASYIGRGVRTAQRWEQYGLPVRRVAPGPRASVIADAHEIDQWLRSARTSQIRELDARTDFALRSELSKNVKAMRALRVENALLRERSKLSLLLVLKSVRNLEQSCREFGPDRKMPGTGVRAAG
jgi:hypothetical protein